MEKLNLFEKIQKVSEEVMNLEKDMTVGSGNYKYKAVSDVQVTLAVKKAEIKHRVLSIPIKQEVLKSEIVKEQKEDRQILHHIDNIKMTVRFIDLDNISSTIDVEALGKGIDSSDKGYGKASTYARKYALLNAYKIATGEDPDANKSQPIQEQTIDVKKDAVINACLIDETRKNNVLSHFNLGSLEDLDTKQINIIHKQFKTNKIID